MNALVKLVSLGLVSSVACAQMGQLEAGKKAIHARTGCFLVDYSFVETETLKPGYVRDNRVYDVNKDKSVKEWIIATEISPTRVKLQHVLQGVTLKGEHMPGGIIRHTGEDWSFNASSRFEYQGPNAKGEDTWKTIQLEPNQWLRRVTSLDDGLRYQCSAAWTTDTEYASWKCDDMAPIPGREYRDMKRKDYQDLERSSKLVVYDTNWLEREANTKIVDADGVKTPLVKELGKTWYVRLPDAECKDAQEFASPRRVAFWDITREAWDEELAGVNAWSDAKTAKGKDSRYGRIADMEETWIRKDLSQPAVRAEAKDAVKKVIEETQAGK
ncbi:DUF6607 family protein [Terriglobus roseus]|uniref:Uncharacterized protein n=1 Tax=Terriglobus roseus TaxID=392734 RepID=A0A1G7H2Q2_9BACT|nr:DUF6607 family protein [Terriglobus roseus]SDE94687.1 hypothetical protein SAMN05444167_0897 [Terriglobus roseus]